MFVIEVGSKEILITDEGKTSIDDISPSVFPYTLKPCKTVQEYYDYYDF